MGNLHQRRDNCHLSRASLGFPCNAFRKLLDPAAKIDTTIDQLHTHLCSSDTIDYFLPTCLLKPTFHHLQLQPLTVAKNRVPRPWNERTADARTRTPVKASHSKAYLQASQAVRLCELRRYLYDAAYCPCHCSSLYERDMKFYVGSLGQASLLTRRRKRALG